MESNINLESLRELSNSQLEALLRYDSPPETPAQPADPTISGDYIRGDLNSMNWSIPNRDELSRSPVDSQIDFSVFQHHSPNIKWSLSPLNIETNHSNIGTSILDDKNKTNVGVAAPNEFAANVNDCSFTEKTTPVKCFGRTSSSNSGCVFKEVDNWFKKNEYISNLNLNYMNRCEGSTFKRTKCHTQIEMNSKLSNSPGKIVQSCPIHRAHSSMHSKGHTCKTNNDQSAEDNERNMDPLLCLSLDQNIADNMIDVSEFFKEPEACHIFYSYNSDQEQPLIQVETHLQNSFHKSYLKTDFHSCPAKNFTNIVSDASSIPFSVKQLYNIVKANYSDFAFIYALSSQLCQDRVPMECFVTLKIGLLLSLVSIGHNEYSPPIPIVAIGNDTYMTDYLMSNIGQLGSRFLGPVDETKLFYGASGLEADSILLAKGGVYYAGDWTRLKLRRAESIFKNIECSSVAVEKSTVSFPLETAIWTHWRSFKYNGRDQQTFNKFLKIFGIPIFVSDDNHDVLIDYTLEQSSIRVFESTVDHLSISEDDMRTFLVHVSQNNVELSPEAALLLKNYFVSSRSIRQDCLSKQSYTVLKQFAESFAKLSMRKVVLCDDVLAAIIMCEHFIENVFSSTDNSPPHFGNFTFIGAVDKYLVEFKKWLNCYAENFTNE